MPLARNPRPFRVIPGGNATSSVTELTDERLTHAVRQGDAAAAAAFHDRVRPVVDRTLRRLIGVRDPDYDDLAQLALIELVFSLDRFRGECPLDAWGAIVVARVAYKHVRRRKIERRLFALEVTELPEVADRSSVASIAYGSLVRQIERHLRAIDIHKAWTFVLHDVHGYDLEEIGTITGVSRAAAQSRLVRGRKLIHERIARDPELSQYLTEFKTVRGT